MEDLITISLAYYFDLWFVIYFHYNLPVAFRVYFILPKISSNISVHAENKNKCMVDHLFHISTNLSSFICIDIIILVFQEQEESLVAGITLQVEPDTLKWHL